MKTQQMTLLTPEEASREFFDGRKSYGSMVAAARKKQLPCVRVGNRIFFERNSLVEFFVEQLSMPVVTIQSTSNLHKDHDTVRIAGIKKID